MAKKDDDDDKKLKAKEKEAEDKDEKDEPSEDVEVEIEGEKPERKEKEEPKEDKGDKEEVEVEVADPEEEQKRLSQSQARRQRQREAREAKDREIAALRAQNAELEGRVQNIEQRRVLDDAGSLERGMYDAARQVQEAKDIIARGIKEQNGEAVAQAQEAMYAANRRYEQLQARAAQIQRQRQEQPAPRVDPLLAKHAKDWMSKNRWYDVRGYDEDSRIALTIDAGLANEGWDPKTPEYWDEFSDRVAKYLPHRAQKGAKPADDDDDVPDSRTRGSGRESGGGSTKTTYRLSKDRVDALKEAGQWDDFQKDSKFRSRMLRRFKEADEKHST